MILLTGKSIRLRAVEPGDLDAFYEWENDPQNWLVGNTLVPFSRHVLEKYIDSARVDIYEARQLRLMIESTGEASTGSGTIGTIDLFDFDPQHRRAGVGILIARKEHRMQGLATEALEILIKYAFSTLQLHQLYCNINEDNLASLKLFKKHGFREIGKKVDWIRQNNSWINVILLQLINPYED